MSRAAALLFSLALALPAAAGEPRAWTRGDFRLDYALERDGDRVRARRAAVTVRNSVKVPPGAGAKLREHEEVHARINRAEAARIEASLAAWSAPWPADGRIKAAERAFKREFSRLVSSVDKMHRDWDETHKP